MKGGLNKLLRNIVAGASDTEFEKVILQNYNSILHIQSYLFN